MVVTAQTLEQDFVDAHNAARAAVGIVEPVSWNSTVAAWAANYAEERRGDCALTHSPAGRPYGENLLVGHGTDSVEVAMKFWVAEKQYYDHGSNTCSAPSGDPLACGHYTQIVWRKSTDIGCARVVCANGSGVFIICSYSPAGNIPGESPY
jgi:pathogenesis-related protein 1